MVARKSEVRVPSEPSRHAKTVGLLVVGLIIGVLIGLLVADQRDEAQPIEAGVITGTDEFDGPDPFEAYEAARAERLPMYVLFHSGGGCPPCVEARDLAGRVLPDYEGRKTWLEEHEVMVG